jgi:hypothetical protein
MLTLFAAWAAPARAQDVDVIRGRVTGTDSAIVASARVTVTSIAGNVRRVTQTDKNGRFTMTFPGGEGDYMVSIAAIGYVSRTFEVKRTADQDVLIADARLSRIVQELDPVEITAGARINRNDNPPDISGTDRPILTNSLPPELQGDIAAMAASLPGVTLVPGVGGEADAFSVLGLSPDQNNTTLNGMPFNGSTLPRDASVSSSLVTSPYDVSRGGFSGGQFSVRSRPGTNYQVRGMSLNLNSPQFQWSDRAAQSLGQEYSNMSVSGMASGPIRYNKAFYNVSYQLGRRSNDLRTLLNTDPVGLQTAGIAPDSVVHLLLLLSEAGVPATIGAIPDDRNNDQGAIFGSFDFNPPNSLNGSAYNIAFNGNWSRQKPLGGGATDLPAYSGEQARWSGGVQARHSGYFRNFLTETSIGTNLSTVDASPFLLLPAGRVRVNSTFPDGTNGVTTLSFGGNQGQNSVQRTTGASFMNLLSWFSANNAHRLKLASELRYDGNEQELRNNLLGTFAFTSLGDLDAGAPSSFTRQLDVRRRDSRQLIGGLALGDSWRRTPDFQLQYGLRLDGNHFLNQPDVNPVVASTFGRRNDHVPNRIYLSPRIGFSWTLGTAAQIAGFAGAVRGPRAVIRGGVGVFQNTPATTLIASAVENTGLPGAVQQISCVGVAAPIPDWDLYATNPELIPDRCADGSDGTVFANSSPNVTLFDDNYRAPRSVRSNLSWSGSILDNRFSANAEVTYSLNLNQQSQIDLNFDPTVRFALTDEAARPVFVEPTSIVPGTGSIASRDARVSPLFSRVNEIRSDLHSRSSQLRLGLAPVKFSPSQKLTWNLAYVYSNVRERVRGFTSTVGNPLDIAWARSGLDSRHQISYGLGYNMGGWVSVNWNGTFRSGTPFTPSVAGDINGDGYSNDRAFIFDPTATADPQLAGEMSQLLGSVTGRTRDCLERQLGRLAGRNSCEGPWTSSASLNLRLDPVKFRMPQRAQIQFSLSNPLGAADLIMNGSRNLRGWGQSSTPDQALLYVRGFDPSAHRYRYEVNQRFGATRPAFNTLRNPVVLTASMRFDVGPTRERQSLIQQLDGGRRTAGEKIPESFLRSIGKGGIPNAMSQILRQQDTLRLTAEQADSIATMNRRYTISIDSIWLPVSRALAAMPDKYDSDEAYDQYIRAREATADLMMKYAPVVKRILTPSQRRKLPPLIMSFLDKRYLMAIRSGTAMYIGSGGGPSGIGLPAGAIGVPAAEGMVIIRGGGQ